MSQDLNNIDDTNFGDEDYTTSLDVETSSVASSKGSNAIVIILAIVAVIGVAFFMFSGDKDDEVVQEPVQEKKLDKDGNEVKVPVAAPPSEALQPIVEAIDPDITESNSVVEVPDIDIPKLPPMENVKIDLPKTEAIIPEFKTPDIAVTPAQPKTIGNGSIAAPSVPGATGGSDDLAKAPDFASQEPSASGKEQASMMLLNSGGAAESSNNTFVLEPSSFSSVSATKVYSTDRTIIQGKIIEAVLETAINTDFPGSVRGVVSQDVYAETGRNIMIPKGSRLIGSYSGSVESGQTRVLINWERLIRPDAVDIAINSPATDQFGRFGVPGDVDNKYLELFNNSILLSLITIGTAIALEEQLVIQKFL